MPTDWIALDDLECGEAWIEGEETVRWRTNRLFDEGVPFSTDLATDAMDGVFVAVDPGHACERHTHDEEELILVHRGTLEFGVGDHVTTRRAGELTVVPPGVPHGFRNVGDGPASVLAIPPSSGATTTFERAVQPVGARVIGPDGPVREDPGDG